MAPATTTSIDRIAKAEEELTALGEELRGYEARGLKDRIKLVKDLIKTKTKALDALRDELEPNADEESAPVDEPNTDDVEDLADAEADELEEREATDDLERAVPDPDELETR